MQGKLALAVVAAALTSAAPAEASKKLSVQLEGLGAVTGAGISCVRDADGVSGTCRTKVRKARTVTLRATTEREGFAVRSWSGCASSTPTSCVVRLDRHRQVVARFGDVAAPAVALAEVPAFTKGVVALAATASDNDRVDRVRFLAGDRLVAEDATAPYEASLDTATLPEGPVTVRAVAVDAADNASTASRSLVVDRTAPVVSLVGDTTDTRTESSRPFSVRIQDAAPVSLFCLPNGEPIFDCDGGFTVRAQPGIARQSVFVRATDAAGNVGDAEASWKYDPVAPTIEVFTPFFVFVGERAEFGLEVDDRSGRDSGVGVASITCAFDGAAAVPCAGRFTTPPLTEDRTYTLVVTATDRLGNASTATSDVRTRPEE